MPRWIPLLLLAAGLTACTPSFPATSSEPAAAVVDGQTVFSSAYQARLNVTRHRDPIAGLATPATSPAVRLDDFTIEQLIRETVVAEEAAHRGVQVSDADVQSRINGLRQRAGAQEFTAALQRNGFTPGSYTAYEKALLEEVGLVHAMAKDRVESADRELHGGRALALVAAQWSDDTGTSARGGDAGWVRPAELPEPALAAAVQSLATGKTSGVISTTRGFVIASVLERRADQVHLAAILVLAPAPDAMTSDNTPSWFTRYIGDRLAALRKAGKIQVMVGIRASG